MFYTQSTAKDQIRAKQKMYPCHKYNSDSLSKTERERERERERGGESKRERVRERVREI